MHISIEKFIFHLILVFFPIDGYDYGREIGSKGLLFISSHRGYDAAFYGENLASALVVQGIPQDKNIRLEVIDFALFCDDQKKTALVIKNENMNGAALARFDGCRQTGPECNVPGKCDPPPGTFEEINNASTLFFSFTTSAHMGKRGFLLQYTGIKDSYNCFIIIIIISVCI